MFSEKRANELMDQVTKDDILTVHICPYPPEDAEVMEKHQC